MESLVEQFIHAAVSGSMDHTRYLELFREDEAKLYAFCNKVALVIAQRFLDDKMSFDDADAVANEFYALYIGETVEIPEPADSIYLAFDGGEYAIDGEDPVENYTRPTLRGILASHSKTQ